jgi:sugar O-acyltransferase (sialic acid O-acetyltransferase NeuD family)
MNSAPRRLVIFGLSNILSDLFDAALACGMAPTKVVIHHPEQPGDRDLPVATRLAALARCCPGSAPPALSSLDDFVPEVGEAYLLGPTTPTRARLAALLQDRFGLEFCTLVHPRAYVSPLAALEPGVFVGANSVIAPGVHLDTHVFVNRGATVGHDTRVGAFSRIQPGANLGGLSRVGAGVTIGLGASVVERLAIGDGSVVAAGAVVLRDVPPRTMVAGVPATVRKLLAGNVEMPAPPCA